MEQAQSAGDKQPRLSVIIPSWTGEISQVRQSLAEQTFQDFELLVVVGVSPAARARNEGVRRSKSDRLLFIDDDAYLGTPDTLERLIQILETHPEFAIIGPAKLLPPHATPFERRVGAEVPRFVFPVVDTLLESNPPTSSYGFSGLSTTCILMHRSWYDAVGGFDESLPTGPEDTEFFFRLRLRGARFAIAPRVWVYHSPPRTVGILLRKSFAYGVGHALEAWREPGRNMKIIPLDRWYGKGMLLAIPLLFLISPFVDLSPHGHGRRRIGWHPLKALAACATLSGYIVGWHRYVRGKDPAEQDDEDNSAASPD